MQYFQKFKAFHLGTWSFQDFLVTFSPPPPPPNPNSQGLLEKPSNHFFFLRALQIQRLALALPLPQNVRWRWHICLQTLLSACCPSNYFLHCICFHFSTVCPASTWETVFSLSMFRHHHPCLPAAHGALPISVHLPSPCSDKPSLTSKPWNKASADFPACKFPFFCMLLSFFHSN